MALTDGRAGAARRQRGTEFEFRVVKEAASAGLLKELAGAVLRLWNGPPQQ
ncbi:hypothetical protein [Streptomyces cupreus]|uniref:Uncharacterized protein n=1 Tax=Streptomyces cupreus TaxID=2759956 RepID=A0A7X1J0L6_9ACTN|nr:hypothetical protein [Streptomyces cupreus]MBC2902013.1 hypothetical protein [Streptomyces cupreus]